MTWRTFLRAHWHALFAADFFTTEIWTVRGLVTYYRVFVIELHSRRVQVLGSTPNPDEAFVVQTMRHLTDDVDGMLRGDRLLICDRDRKWSAAVERFLATAGVRVIRTPLLAPNCNAYADRFVRSIREECLNRVIPLGDRHLRRTLAEFVAHYHGERNHHGLDNELIDRPPRQTRRRSRSPARAYRWTPQLLLLCRRIAGRGQFSYITRRRRRAISRNVCPALSTVTLPSPIKREATAAPRLLQFLDGVGPWNGIS